MKTTIVVIVLLIVSVALCPPSFAKDCATDLDCDVYESERCIIPADKKVGVCTKSEPHREKERKPVTNTPPASPLKKGQFCMTNNDCEPGQSCVKKENAFSGTCR